MTKANHIDPRERIIVALDVSARPDLEKWAALLKSHVRWVKVGMELFYAQGPEVITFLREQGFNIFLDLKLHDIPNTVQKAAVVLARLGVGLINLHTLGGVEMMKRTAAAIKEMATTEGINPPRVIGVTVLTSHSPKVLRDELQITLPLGEAALHLAGMAKSSGLDGVVCSPWEVEQIKKCYGADFLTVVPGIRPSWAAPGDQVRYKTPGQAVAEGADFLVIGRPILDAPDPVAALNSIVQEMQD
ncbi:MAG TPA: orotidine-5'-phosphate decarboxylase [Bacillota bacterium]